MPVDTFQTDETATVFFAFYDGGVPIAVDTAISVDLFDSVSATAKATYTNLTAIPVTKITGGTPDPYYTIANIPLTGYAHGLARAVVTATVDSDPVVPNPFEIEAAFMVVADNGVLYCSAADVLSEIPFDTPSALTDDVITMFIEQAGRVVDAMLMPAGYDTPFPAHDATPAVDPLIKRITCDLAQDYVLQWLAKIDPEFVAKGEGPHGKQAFRFLDMLAPAKGEARMWVTSETEGHTKPGYFAAIPIGEDDADA